MVKILIQKILYGLLFTVALPFLSILWSIRLDELYILPMPQLPNSAIVLTVLGAIIMVWAIINLKIYGKGLPMNAFPPEKLVEKGIYGIIPHPIYTGFILFSFGLSLWLKSPCGFWIISPCMVLGCIALVYGYEGSAIKSRFGNSVQNTLIKFPENSSSHKKFSDIISALCITGLPWLCIYEAGLLWGKTWGGIDISFAFEKDIPVMAWTTIFYSFTYVYVLLVPLLKVPKRIVREFMIAGIIATVLGGIMFFTVPIIAPLRAFVPNDIFGEILVWERQYDGIGGAFPSFHVIWAIIALSAYRAAFPKYAFIFGIAAYAIIVSCFTTGMHSLGDIAAGIIIGISVVRYKALWNSIISLAEKTANSWKEWHFGTIRIINHGIYAGLATMAGICIVSVLMGGNEITGISFITVCSVIGAALWAQIVEGSPALLRPFGYYGALIGGIIGCTIWELLTGNGWYIAAAFSVAAPVIQAIGRMRCLVQGCCHGDRTAEVQGIRVWQLQSRICRIAQLHNENIYPTQVYSIIGNILIMPFLLRLWFVGISPPCIIGTYLLLSGLARFTEEHYRGEPQTIVRGGLRLYQWAAIISVSIGAFLTCIIIPKEMPAPAFSYHIVFHSIFWGIIGFAALGIDFPKSTRRFSRLT